MHTNTLRTATRGKKSVLFGLFLGFGTLHTADGQDLSQGFQRLGEITANAEKFLPSPLRAMTPEHMLQLEQTTIPWTDEQAFGAAVLARYERTLRSERKRLIRRGRDVDYLRRLVETVRTQMQNADRYRQIRVSLIPSEQPDAYSIPGGDLLFTQGLVDTAESEAALIGVVAHELSHLDHGHQLLELKQAKLFNQTTDLNQQINRFISSARWFHPEFETQADEDAVRWMLALSYDPRELAHLLDRWDQRQNQKLPWLDAIPSLIRSHPDAGRRSQQILTLMEKVPAAKLLYVGRKNLQQRVARVQRRYPE